MNWSSIIKKWNKIIPLNPIELDKTAESNSTDHHGCGTKIPSKHQDRYSEKDRIPMECALFSHKHLINLYTNILRHVPSSKNLILIDAQNYNRGRKFQLRPFMNKLKRLPKSYQGRDNLYLAFGSSFKPITVYDKNVLYNGIPCYVYQTSNSVLTHSSCSAFHHNSKQLKNESDDMVLVLAYLFFHTNKREAFIFSADQYNWFKDKTEMRYLSLTNKGFRKIHRHNVNPEKIYQK